MSRFTNVHVQWIPTVTCEAQQRGLRGRGSGLGGKEHHNKNGFEMKCLSSKYNIIIEELEHRGISRTHSFAERIEL